MLSGAFLLPIPHYFIPSTFMALFFTFKCSIIPNFVLYKDSSLPNHGKPQMLR